MKSIARHVGGRCELAATRRAARQRDVDAAMAAGLATQDDSVARTIVTSSSGTSPWPPRLPVLHLLDRVDDVLPPTTLPNTA